jgi:RNA polymerase sigma-70 factor (ECF subfamily)
MDEANTTAVIQRYLVDLDEANSDSTLQPVVRALLSRSIDRLQALCYVLLSKSYPRLKQPPLNLQSDELLSAVVERLLKALRVARPKSVRDFFSLASQHMRWELNDLARRLDQKGRDAELVEGLAMAPESSTSGISPNARRMLEAIEALPDDEREVFSLVRIQGFSQAEVAELLQVSIKTVQRRLNRSLVLLTTSVSDLNPEPKKPDVT